jgi:ribosome-associated protein YbcJ (S4-like RNA binding protein)
MKLDQVLKYQGLAESGGEAKQRIQRASEFIDRFTLHPKRDQYRTDLLWMQDAVEQPGKELRSLMALAMKRLERTAELAAGDVHALDCGVLLVLTDASLFGGNAALRRFLPLLAHWQKKQRLLCHLCLCCRSTHRSCTL